MKVQQDCVNQLSNQNAFFLFLLTGATSYYHDIHIVFTYLSSFTGYEDEILEVSSNLHVLDSKFGGKIYNFGGKSFKKFVFSKFG